MEEEIDLRPYIKTLLKSWHWIVGLSAITGIITFVAAFLLPRTYEATALVTVTSPQQIVLNSLTNDSLAPSFVSVDEVMPLLRAYPELAISDEMMHQLLVELDLPTEEVGNVEQLRRLLTAETGSDVSLLRLIAKYEDGPTAARIVNTWANLFVPWVNDLTNVNRLHFFETQLENAQASLNAAEADLIIFQATNRDKVLQSNLDALNQTLVDRLAEQQSLTILLQDTEQLQTQLMTQPATVNNALAYQLTALNLQTRAYNAELSDGVQLQIAAETTLTGSNRTEQLAFLTSLFNSLTDRQLQIEAELANIEPQILFLQMQQQQNLTERQKLERAQKKAEETYTALARRVDSERISTEDTSGGVKLASNSAIPTRPSNTSSLVLSLAATFIIGMLVVLGLLIQAWWSQATSVNLPTTGNNGNE